MEKCSNCGTVTEDNICPSCGFDLAHSDPDVNKDNLQIKGDIPEVDLSEENLPTEPDPKAPKEKKVKWKNWIPVAAAILVLAIAYFGFIQPKVIKPMQDYNYALEQLEKGNIDEAKKIFIRLGDYKDSAQQIDNCEVATGDKQFNEGNYELALEIYEKHKDNANVTEDKINKCKQEIYQSAVKMLEAGNARQAKDKFLKIKDYSDSQAYIEKCNEAIEKAIKESEEKKAAEEKAAAEKAAKYGKLDSSLADIMKVYIDKYSSIHAYSGSTMFGASLNLYYKDNAYGGVMSCSPSKNSVTVMFQGTDDGGSAEADVNDIPASIMTFFYFDGNPEKEDLMCMITAEGNLLSAIDPGITQEEAYDPVLEAYLDEKEVIYKGFKITSADMMQSQGVVIFKVSADK